jgi:hypothetical protein
MRIQTTPSTTPPPPYIHTFFTPDAAMDPRSTRHRGAQPTQTTTAGWNYIATPTTSQRPVPASTRARERPDTRFCPPFPAQSLTTLLRPGAANTRAHPPTFPIPYSQVLHRVPAATTMQRRSEPPPLDFSKSPYRCIPLPDTEHGPVILNPILAYSDLRTASNISQRPPVDVHHHHHHHICAPATNPSIGSATILLQNGRGITIHASLRSHSFVTVGDMLDALDTLLFGKPSRELSLPVEGTTYGDVGEPCACLSGSTALHSLRSRYERAGLTRNEEGFDVWDLRIG